MQKLKAMLRATLAVLARNAYLDTFLLLHGNIFLAIRRVYIQGHAVLALLQLGRQLVIIKPDHSEAQVVFLEIDILDVTTTCYHLQVKEESVKRGSNNVVYKG